MWPLSDFKGRERRTAACAETESSKSRAKSEVAAEEALLGPSFAARRAQIASSFRPSSGARRRAVSRASRADAEEEAVSSGELERKVAASSGDESESSGDESELALPPEDLRSNCGDGTGGCS